MKRWLPVFLLFFWGSGCWGGALVKFYAYNPSDHELKLVELHKP